MTQAVEKINDIERKVKGKIIIAPLENEIKQRFIQVSKNAKIQGFRPGKAPMSIIEKQYGPILDLKFIQEQLKISLVRSFRKIN